MKNLSTALNYLIVSIIIFFLSSCAYQPFPSLSDTVPGFFMGILHGVILPFAFIGSIFTECRIYAFPNSGFFYDFGYLIGVSLMFGGGGASSGRITSDK